MVATYWSRTNSLGSSLQASGIKSYEKRNDINSVVVFPFHESSVQFCKGMVRLGCQLRNPLRSAETPWSVWSKSPNRFPQDVEGLTTNSISSHTTILKRGKIQ